MQALMKTAELKANTKKFGPVAELRHGEADKLRRAGHQVTKASPADASAYWKARAAQEMARRKKAQP
jgi:hypothetical protein